MPLDHIAFDQSTQQGRLLRAALSSLELGVEGLGDVLGMMNHLINGDGTVSTHFDAMAALIGIPSLTAPSGAVAKAAYEELSSVYAKLNTDASVSNVKAAMAQAFDKFR